ncbi:DUF5683 domain-containing protein [Robertkochia solimangrovi]|uniref:DUF5683 domain-containing protein n=1 Tax=Robertkochia solimangrovi TaxID=2213046 RepID=UPI00117CD364|nr:DUF5683 domain-containing protein [Robertkochia solimangrovi]TRZ43581.1 hypothetical protein DMZ48_09170 [Robertkochia solimangrovi]
MFGKRIAIIFFLFFHLIINAQEKEKDTTTTRREPLKTDNKPVLTSQDSTSADSVAVLSKRELRKIRKQQEKDSIARSKPINPLSPAKAAFYSAILPGLGQIYNKSYWKVPLVYGAIGTGMYFYISNTNEYNRYRDAYKSRLAGFENDEFYDINNSGIVSGSPDVSDAALRDAQEYYQRNRDLSLLITIGLYALNIIDANVDAHLKQYNISDELTFKPYIQQNQNTAVTSYGLSLNFNF